MDAQVQDGVVVLGVRMELRGTELELVVRSRVPAGVTEAEQVARVNALRVRVRRALDGATAPHRPCPD